MQLEKQDSQADMQEVYAGLTKKQRTIFDYIMSHTEEVCFMSLRELAGRIGVSEVSILKLSKAMGYEGFRGMKQSLRKRVQPPAGSGHVLFRPGASESQDRQDVLSGIYKLEFANLADTINRLNADELVECAKALLRAKKVTVFAHDISRVNADYLVYRLNFLRVRSAFVELGKGGEMQAVADLDKDCFAVFFSFPLYYSHMAEVVGKAKSTGAGIATITDSINSPAVVEDGYLFVCKTTTPYFHNSHIVPMIVVELLTSCVAAEMGDRLDRIHEQINRFIHEGTLEE